MISFNRETEPEIYGKTLWMNPDIQYVFGKNIVEYDMQSASLSVSKRFHLMSDDKLETLFRMPKDKRTKEVGLMQRDDKTFSDNIINGILQTRKEFLMKNNLNESSVITLHSDAVIFIQNKPDIYDNIDGVPFINKNRWSSYLRYNNLEMFYGDGEITYKGIPKQMLQQHTLGICQYLLKIFQKMEDYDDSIYDYIRKFQRDYLQDKFPEYYYVSFGHVGKYKNENLQLFSMIAQIVAREMR